MGFAEQLQEIIGRLPGGHQTVLFSATLPKLLVEFARAGEGATGAGLGARKLISTWGVVGVGSLDSQQLPTHHPPLPTSGLTEPVLIRLDVDSKLNEQLKVRLRPCPSAGPRGQEPTHPHPNPGPASQSK